MHTCLTKSLIRWLFRWVWSMVMWIVERFTWELDIKLSHSVYPDSSNLLLTKGSLNGSSVNWMRMIILFVYGLICVDGFSWPCICAAAWDAHCGCWLPSDGTESHPYKELTPLSVLLTDIPSKWYVIYQTMSMNLTSRSPRKAYKIHHVFINLYICKANKWTLAINA